MRSNFLEIASVVAEKTQEPIGSNAKNQTMGAVESPREIGPDARNMGLMLGRWVGEKRTYSDHVYAEIGSGFWERFRNATL